MMTQKTTNRQNCPEKAVTDTREHHTVNAVYAGKQPVCSMGDTQRASRNSCPAGGAAVNCGIRYAKVLYELNMNREAIQKTEEIFAEVPQLRDVFSNPKMCIRDSCNGVSGRNTGLLHSGILNEKNLLRTECCMEGNAEFERVAGELDIPFRRCGKLIVGFGEEERKRLEGLYQRGLDNGVPGIRMIGRDEIKRLDPNVDGEFAIYVPSAGILCPFTRCV